MLKQISFLLLGSDWFTLHSITKMREQKWLFDFHLYLRADYILHAKLICCWNKSLAYEFF